MTQITERPAESRRQTARWNPIRWFATEPNLPAMEDREAIGRLYRRNRAAVLLSVTFGYGFLYTCRLPLSVVKKPLIDSGLFNAVDLGKVGSGFAFGYALGKLCMGFLADHANIRKLFSLGVLCSAIVNLLMLGSRSSWTWATLWFLNGWFQGSGSPCSGVAISNWFSIKERGRCYGIFSSSHSIGEGLTFVATSFLVGYFGWEGGFIGPGLFCILVAIGLFFTLRDRPETMALPPIADWKNDHPAALPPGTKAESVGRAQLAVLAQPAIWVLGLASAMMYVSRYAVTSWGMLYLQEAHGYSTQMAGLMLGMNTVAGLAGCIAYGFISDKLFKARRPPVTLMFGIAEMLSLLVIFYCPTGHPVILTAGFLVFGFTLSGLLAVLGGLFAIDIAGRKATGAAMGFIGVISYLGTAMQELTSGWLIKQGTTETVTQIERGGKMVAQVVKHYDFSRPILFWIGASILSMILAASLWRVKVRE